VTSGRGSGKHDDGPSAQLPVSLEQLNAQGESMRSATFLGLGVLVAAAPCVAQDSAVTRRAATLDSSEIQAAITLGRQTKKAYGYYWGAYASGGLLGTSMVSGFQVYAQGPFGRVATAAARAARNYQPFTVDSVRPDLIAPVLTVLAYPDVLEKNKVSVSPERILLQVVREGSPDTVTVQPLSIDTVPADYANLFGAHIARSGMIATFDLRAVPPLPFDIVVVNPVKEARDHVKSKDQPRLR